jgi:hypothetical protein
MSSFFQEFAHRRQCSDSLRKLVARSSWSAIVRAMFNRLSRSERCVLRASVQRSGPLELYGICLLSRVKKTRYSFSLKVINRFQIMGSWSLA